MSKSLYAAASRQALSASRYRVIAQLGRGGMASVFLAIQSGIAGFRRLSVVKRLRSDFSEADFLDMFQAEARLAVRLNHPNVVHTYEVGHDGDSHFIAMEFLRGQSYGKLLRRVGYDKVPFGHSLRVLIEALKGLEYAHQLADFDGTPLNIVHRDASPSNVFITYDGQIKILDFGIAKALGQSEDTEAGVIKGKMAYMAPEQVTGEGVGPHSDLYAIGVLLWEAVAQKRRWEGMQNAEIMRKLMSGDPPTAPGAADVGLPIEVDALCLQALANDPSERFVSAAEFRSELEALLTRLGTPVSPEDVGKLLADAFEKERIELQATIEEKMKEFEDGPESVTLDALSSLKGGGADSTPSQDETGIATIVVPDQKTVNRQRRRPWLLGAAAVALAGLVGVFVAVGARSEPEPAPSSALTTAPEAPQAPQRVRIQVRATPSSAALYWDDRRLDGNPHVEERERSHATFQLRAEAEGYASQTALLSFDTDRDVSFDLQPLPSVPASESAEPVASAPPPDKPRPLPVRRKSKPGLQLDTADPWQD